MSSPELMFKIETGNSIRSTRSMRSILSIAHPVTQSVRHPVNYWEVSHAKSRCPRRGEWKRGSFSYGLRGLTRIERFFDRVTG